MSESIPYLGSKISLISRSEIRYEGILYTIDPQESIIALAKVQSFGTEDRPTEMPVPSKSDVYEYIIFRGTDIKKIEVCDTPKPLSGLHNDPAIVGLQVQQHSGHSVGTSYPGTSFSHQSLGPIGSVGSYYGSYGQQLNQPSIPTSGFAMGVSQPSELSGGTTSVEPHASSGSSQSVAVPHPIGAPPSGISHIHNQDVLSGSRSSTPSVSRKSPVTDAGVQVSPPPPPPQQPSDKKKPSPQNTQNNQRPLQQSMDRQQPRGNQNNQQRRNQGGYYQGHYEQGNRYQGYPGQGYYQGQQQYQGQYRGATGRGRPTRRSSQSRGRGVFNQGNRQRQDQALFEKEFDFEHANEKFEELRTQFAKTKITENGEKVDEKKDDSGHETATTGDESEDSTSSTYYDKTKSFFDSISCEALERSKGRSQRSDWRQERKINVQTFGIASARRGYYPRGRGGYYNRGYYRNYNNQGYFRNNMNSNYYRNSRGGGGGGGQNISSNPNRSNGVTTGEAETADTATSSNSSYASAVRSSVAAK